jgi:DNA invertase Pin-like site-specific DNA recombinase
MDKFIAYYRVSTQKQGRSGLGLDAQRSAVARYLDGGKWKIVAEFIEIESGKRSDRPELHRALDKARVYKCPVVVAKVDRLTRSVSFLSQLLDAGVDVRFADLPEIEGPTGRFMLQQMASVAELEGGLISRRTKEALQAAKKRGVKLGGQRRNARGKLMVISKKAAALGRAAVAVRAAARALELAGTIKALQASGAKSLRAIAAGLNAQGVPAAKGGEWSAAQVARVLERLG